MRTSIITIGLIKQSKIYGQNDEQKKVYSSNALNMVLTTFPNYLF